MPKTRILAVDDDPKILTSLRLYLEHAGYEVAVAPDGRRALAEARSFRPDLIVLDIMLPHGDGLSVGRLLRAESEVPIVFLSARATEEDRLEGLELGADDYVTKPFSPRELVARVRAVLRRGAGGAAQAPAPAREGPIRAPGLVLDPERHEARVRGSRVALTPREFRLLYALASAGGRVLTREDLAARAFGEEYDGLERTVDAHVMNLRRKIEIDPARPRYVETVFGVGYRFGGGRVAA